MNYLIYGHEPYLISKKMREILANLDSEMVSTVSEFTKETASMLATLNIFGTNVVVYKPNSLKEVEKCTALFDYLNNPSDAGILILAPTSYDARATKIFKSLEKHFQFVLCDRLSHSALISHIKEQGGITDEEAKFIADSSGYTEDTDVDLFKVLNLCNKVKSYKESTEISSLSKETIFEICGDNTKQKVFSLLELLDSADYDGFVFEMKKTPLPDLLKVLGLLFKKIRATYNAKLYGKKEVGAYSYNLCGLSEGTLYKLLCITSEVSASLSNYTLNEEAALTKLCGEYLLILKSN